MIPSLAWFRGFVVWVVVANYLVDPHFGYWRTEVIGPFPTRAAAIAAAETDDSVAPAQNWHAEMRTKDRLARSSR